MSHNPWGAFSDAPFTSTASPGMLREVARKRRRRRLMASAAVALAVALMATAVVVIGWQQRRDDDGFVKPDVGPQVERTVQLPSRSSTARTIEVPSPSATQPRPVATGPTTINKAPGLMPGILPDPSELGWPVEDLVDVEVRIASLDGASPFDCDSLRSLVVNQPFVQASLPGSPQGSEPRDTVAAVALSTPNGPALATRLETAARQCTEKLPYSWLEAEPAQESLVGGTLVRRWRQVSQAGERVGVRWWATIHTTDVAVILLTEIKPSRGRVSTEQAERATERAAAAVVRNLTEPRFSVGNPGERATVDGLPAPLEAPGLEWQMWSSAMGPATQGFTGACDANVLVRRFPLAETHLAGEISTFGEGPRLFLHGWWMATSEAADNAWAAAVDNASSCKVRGEEAGYTVTGIRVTDIDVPGADGAWVARYSLEDVSPETWGAVRQGSRIWVVHLAAAGTEDPVTLVTQQLRLLVS